MELTSVFGLPAHPFIVHIPVVILPLTALAAIVMLVWGRSRRILAPVVAGGALVGFLGAMLATGSGEALEENIRNANRGLVHDHAELGEMARNLAFLFLVAAVAYLITQWPEKFRLSEDSGPGRFVRGRGARIGVSIAIALTAVAVTGGVVQAGHSGAKAVWQEEWKNRPAGEAESDSGRVTPAAVVTARRP